MNSWTESHREDDDEYSFYCKRCAHWSEAELRCQYCGGPESSYPDDLLPYELWEEFQMFADKPMSAKEIEEMKFKLGVWNEQAIKSMRRRKMPGPKDEG